jgi:Fucose permease
MTFMLPLTGLFFAIVLPTATAVLSTIIKTNIGAILGLFFCFVGLGGMAGPWLQGVLNDYIGLKLGMLTPALFGILMLVCLFLIVKEERKKESAAF